ncbi:hypothetical protein [Flammeovirga aprica]|uniref:Outer membrane protein beta-barrel domain-containing protein n=1 Tax=Flammeovirga aprica JL-4 TaxID=694437 RepID=A0A7X9S1T1_9BACT|nr:hypothetical protein [Flammeovirga aprica]NME72592.1 hypothetical protein [Flammeovirga aprica JL-4]
MTQKINTLSILLISAFLFLIVSQSSLYAQNHRPHRFGIDITKTLTLPLISSGQGFIIEPVYYYADKDKEAKFKAVIGYSNTRYDNIFVNNNIKTTGFYIKPGIGTSLGKKNFAFLNLLVSNYSINNKYVLEGKYFGDFNGEYTHNNLFALGIEPNIDFENNLGKKVSMILSLRFTYIFYNPENKDYPVYYVPGAGITNGNQVSAGLSFYLIIQ